MASSTVTAKSYWPLAIVSFLLVIITFNVYFAYTAISTNRGVVDDHPYESALEYQKVIDLKVASKSLGWKGSLDLVNGELIFAVNDKEGSPISSLSVSLDGICLSCSDDKRVSVSMEESGSAVYRAVQELEKGTWNFEVRATRKKQVFFFEKRMLIP